MRLALFATLIVILSVACDIETTPPTPTPTQTPTLGVQRGCEAAEDLFYLIDSLDVGGLEQHGEALMVDLVVTGNERLYRQSQRISDAMLAFGTNPSSDRLRNINIQMRTYLLTCESEGFDSSVDL